MSEHQQKQRNSFIGVPYQGSIQGALYAIQNSFKPASYSQCNKLKWAPRASISKGEPSDSSQETRSKALEPSLLDPQNQVPQRASESEDRPPLPELQQSRRSQDEKFQQASSRKQHHSLEQQESCQPQESHQPQQPQQQQQLPQKTQLPQQSQKVPQPAQYQPQQSPQQQPPQTPQKEHEQPLQRHDEHPQQQHQPPLQKQNQPKHQHQHQHPQQSSSSQHPLPPFDPRQPGALIEAALLAEREADAVQVQAAQARCNRPRYLSRNTPPPHAHAHAQSSSTPSSSVTSPPISLSPTTLAFLVHQANNRRSSPDAGSGWDLDGWDSKGDLLSEDPQSAAERDGIPIPSKGGKNSGYGRRRKHRLNANSSGSGTGTSSSSGEEKLWREWLNARSQDGHGQLLARKTGIYPFETPPEDSPKQPLLWSHQPHTSVLTPKTASLILKFPPKFMVL